MVFNVDDVWIIYIGSLAEWNGDDFVSKKKDITHIIYTLMKKIPGLTFSWKRALGLTQARKELARKTGIPTTKAGLERKLGKLIIQSIFGKK